MSDENDIPDPNRLELAGLLAPIVRSLPPKAHERRVGRLAPDGSVVGYATWAEVLASQQKRHALEIDVVPGVRPKTSMCRRCGKPFDTNAHSKVAAYCSTRCRQLRKKCEDCRTPISDGIKCRDCWLSACRKTHCPNGHELSADNVLAKKKRNGSTTAVCRTCSREDSYRRYIENKTAQRFGFCADCPRPLSSQKSKRCPSCSKKAAWEKRRQRNVAA